jgi:hypothetical protein
MEIGINMIKDSDFSTSPMQEKYDTVRQRQILRHAYYPILGCYNSIVVRPAVAELPVAAECA